MKRDKKRQAILLRQKYLIINTMVALELPWDILCKYNRLQDNQQEHNQHSMQSPLNNMSSSKSGWSFSNNNSNYNSNNNNLNNNNHKSNKDSHSLDNMDNHKWVILCILNSRTVLIILIIQNWKSNSPTSESNELPQIY